MVKFLQINLHRAEAAQDLLYQSTKEQEASIPLQPVRSVPVEVEVISTHELTPHKY